MAQYCRYCSELIVGDFAYCYVKKKQISETAAKKTNKCPHFDLNKVDAFLENEKGYQPRQEKKKECDGQLTLDSIESKV